MVMLYRPSYTFIAVYMRRFQKHQCRILYCSFAKVLPLTFYKNDCVTWVTIHFELKSRIVEAVTVLNFYTFELIFILGF